MTQNLTAYAESWPIAGTFTISRGTKSEAHVVVAEIGDDISVGRGECVPYTRYGESVDGVLEEIQRLRPQIENDADRTAIQSLLPPGAARNAIDCALWDLETKQTGKRCWEIAGIPPIKPVETAYTISLNSPEIMAHAAARSATRPLLKLKLGGDGDEDRIHAVREAVPGTRLIVDANEGWNEQNLERLMDVCAQANVELIEQPLPSRSDSILGQISHPVPICADESAHGLDGFEALSGRYDAINIKLDKTGGITEALALADIARKHDMAIMVGCMLATSLSMAPAMLVAQHAAYVDLDGPLLLARDRRPGLKFDGSRILPPEPGLWG